MPQEARSRITLLLPAPSTLAQFLLVNDIISEIVGVCRGATVSQNFPPIFDGWWMPHGGGALPGHDAIVLILGDLLAPPESPALLTYLDNLKMRCQTIFQEEIIWITVHGVTRINTGDFVR